VAVSSYEANGCLFAAAFAFVGGTAGWTTLGLFGAFVGAPLGCVVGWFTGWFLVDANFRHSI
jgi:NhaP-type Na+/H+ or K+/H+ antiporter